MAGAPPGDRAPLLGPPTSPPLPPQGEAPPAYSYENKTPAGYQEGYPKDGVPQGYPGSYQGGGPVYPGQPPAGYSGQPPAGYAGQPPVGYAGPAGYQPQPGQQPSYITGQPHAVIVETQTVIVGGCPACRIGVLEDDFTCLGVCCAIFFFPLGLICCLLMRHRRCPNCGAIFG